MNEKKTTRKPMRRSVFWLNILAMVIVAIVAVFLTFKWLDIYTQHGKAILVPDVTQIDEQALLARISVQAGAKEATPGLITMSVI